MFLAPRQRKTTVFTRFWASASKNHSIYSVLWPGPSKNTGIYAVSCMLSEAFLGCQRHKNIVNYTIFTRGQYQKIMKNWPKTDQKTPNKDLQNASANFTLFSPTPNPQKRENPSRLKDFRRGSAAPARPRVAKAMLSNHHRTASPDLRAAAPAADPGKVTKQLSCVMEPSEPMAVTGSMSIQVRAMWSGGVAVWVAVFDFGWTYNKWHYHKGIFTLWSWTNVPCVAGGCLARNCWIVLMVFSFHFF